ncbi:hypothetical protein XFF6960_260023 [Xanthomonas citri pv. fuscans]|nr:hypothetical protein XFF6960_260023 [Xanthomonas citri pv. fuscans]
MSLNCDQDSFSVPARALATCLGLASRRAVANPWSRISPATPARSSPRRISAAGAVHISTVRVGAFYGTRSEAVGMWAVANVSRHGRGGAAHRALLRR